MNKLPTIPEYFKAHVDSTIDLVATPHCACPFHGEVSGKSFSYKIDGDIWSCFGACHILGGDVVALHKLNYKLASREEAERSLYAMYNVKRTPVTNFKKRVIDINPEDVMRRRVYALAIKCARTPDDWLALDYILSKVPYEPKELETFCIHRGIDASVFTDDNI